jgi:hypothetical protein
VGGENGGLKSAVYLISIHPRTDAVGMTIGSKNRRRGEEERLSYTRQLR